MARHLFRVAAGLDSMVVGESEIQGQVRAAAAMAESLGVCGPALGALFRQARQVGRRVRRKTAIGAGAVSVSSVAVSVACQAFAGLRGRRALLLGAGTTAEATARALLARGLSSLLVANRTLRAAARLSTRFGATAISLDELPSQLPRVDIVIASTDAQRPLLHRRDVEVALGLRGARPLMMVDIGVPRDLDPGIGELDGVTLCDIDDLERLAHDNLHVRQREAERAERIVDDEVRRFERRQGPGAPEEGGAEVILLVPPAPTPQLLTARRA